MGFLGSTQLKHFILRSLESGARKLGVHDLCQRLASPDFEPVLGLHGQGMGIHEAGPGSTAVIGGLGSCSLSPNNAVCET